MASIRRHPKSGRWQVRYRDPDGRQRSRTFARKVDARKYVSTVAADVLRGEFVDPVAGRATFGEYSKRWQATRGDLSRSSRDRDASYLRSLILPVFGHREIGSIRTSEIGEWVATLDRASATRGKALRIVFNVFELARGDEALKVNPATDVKPPKVSRQATGRALTDDEVSALRVAAEAVDVRTAAMAWVMAGCGLRIGEVLALKRGDVDFENGLVSVAGSMSRREGVTPPKTEAGVRTIPMPSDVAERLRRHLSEQEVADLGGFVFVAPRGGPVRYNRWRSRTWSRIVEAAGVGDVHPHDLRHTCATRLFVVDRWTPAEVQRFLGHSDPRVTLGIYTHVAAESLPAPSSLTEISKDVVT